MVGREPMDELCDHRRQRRRTAQREQYRQQHFAQIDDNVDENPILPPDAQPFFHNEMLRDNNLRENNAINEYVNYMDDDHVMRSASPSDDD